VTTTNAPAKGTPAVYQVRLPLSAKTLTFVADLLRAHLEAIGSRWRKLPAGKIAVIVLAVLRHDQRLADMADGNDVSPGTVRRWLREVLRLLAARAPRLDLALAKVAGQGGEVVLIDATLIRTERRSGKDNRKHYSGKHKTHGLLFLALTDVAGNLLWISAAQKQANQLISSERATVEHAFADLKNWRILTKLRMDAAHATMLLRAPLVLTHSEITR